MPNEKTKKSLKNNHLANPNAADFFLASSDLASLLREIAGDSSLTGDQQNDLRYILAHIFGCEKAKLILYTDQKLTPAQMITWQKAKSRLLDDQEPVHYIINRKNFMGMDFYVDRRVLVPRFDTELLVEKSLEEARKIADGKSSAQPTQSQDFASNSKAPLAPTLVPNLDPPPAQDIKILELCTGSGAIAISLLAHWQEKNIKLKIDALDISPQALEVAQLNASELLDQEKQAQLNLFQSDLFSHIPPGTRYHMLVANPPYIPQAEYLALDANVKKEPILALVADEDGLFFYREILTQARDYLQPGAPIIFEIGYNQGPALKKIADNLGYKNCQIIADYAGHDRIALTSGDATFCPDKRDGTP